MQLSSACNVEMPVRNSLPSAGALTVEESGRTTFDRCPAQRFQRLSGRLSRLSLRTIIEP